MGVHGGGAIRLRTARTDAAGYQYEQRRVDGVDLDGRKESRKRRKEGMEMEEKDRRRETANKEKKNAVMDGRG